MRVGSPEVALTPRISIIDDCHGAASTSVTRKQGVEHKRIPSRVSKNQAGGFRGRGGSVTNLFFRLVRGGAC